MVRCDSHYTIFEWIWMKKESLARFLKVVHQVSQDILVMRLDIKCRKKISKKDTVHTYINNYHKYYSHKDIDMTLFLPQRYLNEPFNERTYMRDNLICLMPSWLLFNSM